MNPEFENCLMQDFYWFCRIIQLRENTIFVPTSQLQRHRSIVKSPRTKGCDVSLVTFQQKSYS